MLSEARRSSVDSAKCTVTRLRSLLRFLHVEVEISHDLTGAVPRIASWRLASLVKAMDGDKRRPPAPKLRPGRPVRAA